MGSRFLVCFTLAPSNTITTASSINLSNYCLILITPSKHINLLENLSRARVLSCHGAMNSHAKLVFKCFSPLSDPGNHGSSSFESLQVAPFQSEGNSIWIGYHNQPSRKYLGVFPSYEEVIDRCQRNAFAGGANTSFPRFRTDVRLGNGIFRDPDCPGSYWRPVCCAGCQDHGLECERLKIKFLPVETNSSKYSKVFLVEYKFNLRGEPMVALLHHSAHGRYSFQKTDGTLSKVLAVDSRHCCLSPPQLTTLQDDEANSETSSLTQFDCVEEEDTTDVRSHSSPVDHGH